MLSICYTIDCDIQRGKLPINKLQISVKLVAKPYFSNKLKNF
jgi:hypothetical protein